MRDNFVCIVLSGVMLAAMATSAFAGQPKPGKMTFKSYFSECARRLEIGTAPTEAPTRTPSAPTRTPSTYEAIEIECCLLQCISPFLALS